MNEVVDWSNPNCKLSQFFSVREALWLSTWGRLATIDDGLTDVIKGNLVKLSTKLDQLRVFFNTPMIVTSMYRPPEYSRLVGGTMTDVHTRGLACDFTMDFDESLNQVKEALIPRLDAFGIRLERGTTNWIHIDTGPVGPSGRYFNP